ncbi:hypothetical protein [uncultured Winogradskyella sp.]|uniref:hypothetical protein n=1 Tax=uncultured Winogradskyella sp. TaxID=395353 RepID=UPI00260A9009|nr:hypothetical protein [uncultured Winogradskyella sp.]
MKHFRLLLSLTLILTSCEETKSKSITVEEETIKLSPNRPNLNISILIDLSDRINPKKYPNPAMEYFERDLGYIHSIAKSFEWHVRNKRSIKINDHIQLYIDPEPSDSNLNEKINSLNITFTKNNAKREVIMKTSALYDSISKQIYRSAIEDNNYVGSDIWGFFKTKVEDFCLQDEHRNILVILTDGYLYHKDAKLKEDNLTSYLTPQDIRNFKLNKPDWKDKIQDLDFGFISTKSNLKELEVLVLGINPDPKNPYEQDVIFQYWKDWLTKMNVKDFEIKTAILPANMDKIIKDYILKE